MSTSNSITTKPGIGMVREVLEVTRSRSRWRNIPTVITIVGFIAAVFGILPPVSDWIHLMVSGILGGLSFIYIFWLIVDISYALGQRWSGTDRIRLHQVISRLHGLEYARLELYGKLDTDGSMVFTRTMEAVAHDEGINAIDHYMHTPEALTRLGPTAPDIPVPTVEIIQGKHTATATIHRQSKDHLRFIVNFTPQLRVDNPVVYVTKEHYSKQTFAIFCDQLREVPTNVRDREYFAWDITHPTKSFKLEIEFPPNLHPKTFEPEVWRGASRVVKDNETMAIWESLKPVPRGDSTSLVLEVDYPLLGLTYVIKWKPPDRPNDGS